ncbi:MAG: DsrE family protein [Hyphomicrobiales bacterium]|nr:DsrE family protein [Hyphomicrobiales bacterium]MDE2114544.1 DsrE family protein [Hyphomicrobiales bacterium]
MERRNFFRTMMLAAASGATIFSARGKASAATHVSKVVYHLDDVAKVNFVVENNMTQHITGVGGPKNVKMALVVLGPALASFKWSGADAGMAGKLQELHSQGVELNACSNTMKKMNITLKDLLPGFIPAVNGGNVRLVELQNHGYAYLRP